MAAESLEERMVEVLGLPEELDEELLWLFFENRRRSGGGTLESVKKNGHRAILVFSAAEDASRVLSKQPHNLCNCELRVRKPVTKDQHRLLLQGVSPNTSMEMIELYVENMLGLNVQEYILNPSPDRDVILIQLNQPLSKDFQTVSTKISRRTLDGTRVTLEEVEHTDSVLVENLPPSTCPDFLTLYFEGSRGGNQRVNEVTMLSEATAKVSFVNFESVDCILDMSHKLEGVDLLVKPYFGFLLPKQLPTSEQCEKEIQDDTVMNSVHPNDFQTEVSHSTETSYCARDQKAVEVLGAFEVVDEVTQDIIEETVDTDAQQSHNAITNPAEQSLDPCCTVQQDLKEVSLNIAIKIKDNGVHSTQSEQKTVKQLANIPPDFVENMVSVILNVKPEMLHFLTQTDVKEWFIENMDQSCSPTTYTVLDSSLVVTAPSKDAAQQACWFLDSQACHFSVPVEAECQYILYCSEWTEFLHTLSCCSVTVSEQGENLLIWTLKEKENENQAAIQNFLTMPIEREMVIPMEPGMLKYIQTHCHQLLADMAQVSIFPLEGDYVHGLKIHGLAVACQTAEELLQGVVSSILSRTITVNAPGVTRFLREKECESILKEMETKFQVSITLQHEPWEPLNNLDFFDMAWKMMTQENFQKVSSPEHRSASVHNVSKGAPDKGLLEEAKKIVLTINENQKKCVSSSEHSNDIDDLDLYTADSPTGPIAQADIDVIEDSLLLAKDSSASGSTSLRDGGPNLSCYLDEEVQLSLAIQYSLDSSNWSQDDEDEQLQKALDLSNKMSQCDSVSVKNFEENLLQDNISSRFNNAVCAANVVKLVVFAGYSSDLSRVDIAFRKKVDLRQISEKIEHRNINKMSKYHWKCVEVLKRIHAVEIQVTGLILTVSGFADYVSEAMLDVKRLVDQISTSIPDKEILRTIQWERRESATSHMSLYSADATLFIEKAWKIKLDKVNIQLNNQPHVINFERMQEINVASGKTVEISRKELDQLNEEVPEGEYSLLSNFPEAIKLDVVSDEFQNVVKNFYSTLHEYNNRIRIVQVEKLSNRLLYNQYNLKKASIKKNASYPEIERTLYHGTSETCVKEICTHGFNRSFCGKNATVYGQGVYFAVDSALSVQDKYSPPNNNGYKFVLVSKVLTGDYTKGCHSMKTAPLKETGIIPLRYDSVTDEINKPTLFVIFNDTQAFPEYLITCQRIFMS
ncbi:protein mono-ADP-ribosyltransferase PARP10 isoform X1 [Gouania willdenowi]|uniref:protein mono-ADP-ribosyltransferase PARP10 isoform X1 n=1 Tax=Gouania willdenowi TaxID=441366 RepID=UPI0010550D81|nr:protein mono-ADP-ribosyltransferase PARP10 isoform X1 [Gouania willdenowi]